MSVGQQKQQTEQAAPDGDRVRQLESLLRESEERHALLVEGVKDFALFALDPHGHVTWWGEGARRLAGYDPEEIVGRHFSLLFTPEDQEKGLPQRELETAAASGSAADESWVVRKDGRRFWGSGFSSARRGEGGLTGFVKILRDLTDRQRTHEALREGDMRLRAALAAAEMGTWLWQVPTDKQVLDESLARMMGVPEGRSVVTLEDFVALMHPDDRGTTREAFLRSAREGGPLLVEFRVTRPDGSVRWLRDRGEVFRDRDGRVEYLTGACVDITERRQMEDELRRSRDHLEERVRERTVEMVRSQERALQAEQLAAVGQTVTALAHEGRNALQRAFACLQRLVRRLQGRPEELDLAERTGQALEDLERLFDDVRTYAAPVRLDYQDCDLGRTWREAWAQLAPPQCEADPFRLAQVFTNLFANAMEACPDPVRVTVSCREATLGDRPALQVSVRDNGRGFTEEQRRRAFEPFHSTKSTGTGLGLAICKRIVEAHGGEIALGTDTGSGAEVVITLPKRKP